MVRVTILKPIEDCECGLMDKPIYSEIFDWPCREDFVLEKLTKFCTDGLITDVTVEDYLTGKIKVTVEQLFVLGEKAPADRCGAMGPQY